VSAKLNFKNPMVVDMVEEGIRVADQIDVPRPTTAEEASALLSGSDGTMASEFVAQARARGHDGVILKNFADRVSGGRGLHVIDVYLALDPKQVRPTKVAR
jgi:hypothetical protein